MVTNMAVSMAVVDVFQDVYVLESLSIAFTESS